MFVCDGHVQQEHVPAAVGEQKDALEVLASIGDTDWGLVVLQVAPVSAAVAAEPGALFHHLRISCLPMAENLGKLGLP